MHSIFLRAILLLQEKILFNLYFVLFYSYYWYQIATDLPATQNPFTIQTLISLMWLVRVWPAIKCLFCGAEYPVSNKNT